MENSLVVSNGVGEVQEAVKTFMGLVDEWLATPKMQNNRKPKTRETYRATLLLFSDWLSQRQIVSPTEGNLIEWLNEKNQKTGKELEPATKNLRLSAVKGFYGWLKSEFGDRVIDITKGQESYEDSREHKRGFLLDEQMKQLMRAIDTANLRGKRKKLSKHDEMMIEIRRVRDRAIVGTLLTVGLRAVEIQRLRIKDKYHEGGAVILDVLGKGKNKRVEVKISAKTEKLIDDWLEARKKIDDVLSDEEPMFISLSNNSFGEAITPHAISVLCKFYLEAAGLKSDKICCHALRHSMATNALLKGATLQQVKEQLRHEQITTSMLYVHTINKLANPCSDLIADSIFD